MACVCVSVEILLLLEVVLLSILVDHRILYLGICSESQWDIGNLPFEPVKDFF